MNTTRRSFFRKTSNLAIGGAALALSSMSSASSTRKVLHVTVGDDSWIPTPQELQALTMQASMADLDPKGGFIVTRKGIEITRI